MGIKNNPNSHNILFCNIESNHEYKTYPVTIDSNTFKLTRVYDNLQYFSHTVFNLFGGQDESHSELFLFPSNVLVAIIHENFFGEYGECEVFFSFSSDTKDELITKILEANSGAFSSHNSSILISNKIDEFFMSYQRFDSVETMFSFAEDTLLNLFWSSFYKTMIPSQSFNIDDIVLNSDGQQGRIIHFLIDGGCKVLLADGAKTVFYKLHSSDDNQPYDYSK